MPYAIDGRISTDPIDGGIEISVAEYADALNGLLEGKAVTVEGGNLIIAFPPEPEQPEEQPEEPEPYIPSTPTVIASGVFTVNNGMLQGVEAAAGIAMAFAIGPGQYWLFFANPQDDKSFSVYTASSSGQINVTARELEYIEICVTDGGSPVDPSEFSVQVVRLR